MAYSRWSKDSVWYCFWSAIGPNNTYKWPTKKLKDAQVFEVCGFPSAHVTYGELKRDFKACVKYIEETYSKSDELELEDNTVEWKPLKPTFQQMTEMRGYLLRFMSDVDEHFEWKTFFLHEWYYPIRNEIYWKWKELKNKND